MSPGAGANRSGSYQPPTYKYGGLGGGLGGLGGGIGGGLGGGSDVPY